MTSWMRNVGAVIGIVAAHGAAAAQPGGSDLPVDASGAPINASYVGQPPPDTYQPQQPQAAQPQGPQLPDPATAPTRATFVSATDQPWDVWVDRNAICATPCTLGLTSLNFVTFKTQERDPVRLDVGSLAPGDVIVRGRPLREGMYAGGIVATTFAGIALVTGVTLTAVGWGTGREGMRTAGLITGVAGAVGLYGGIYLMRAALPKVTIGPAQPYVAGNQVGLAGNF